VKYIVTKTQAGTEEIFVFPRSVNHDCMMEALSRIKSQTTGDWVRVPRTPVSAGFVSSSGACFGDSMTLGLKSREKDTALLADQYLV
jgi:hypothetical protein